MASMGHLQREQGNMEGRQMPEKKNTHSRFDNVFFAMVVADRSYGALPGVTKSIGFSASLERFVMFLPMGVLWWILLGLLQQSFW